MRAGTFDQHVARYQLCVATSFSRSVPFDDAATRNRGQRYCACIRRKKLLRRSALLRGVCERTVRCCFTGVVVRTDSALFSNSRMAPRDITNCVRCGRSRPEPRRPEGAGGRVRRCHAGRQHLRRVARRPRHPPARRGLPPRIGAGRRARVRRRRISPTSVAPRHSRDARRIAALRLDPKLVAPPHVGRPPAAPPPRRGEGRRARDVRGGAGDAETPRRRPRQRAATDGLGLGLPRCKLRRRARARRLHHRHGPRGPGI